MSGTPGAVAVSGEEDPSEPRRASSEWVTSRCGDVDAEIGHACERVIPGVALEARVALEQAPSARDSRLVRRAPERLRVLWLGIDRHDQRGGAHGREGRGVAPVVDVGDAGPPGAELDRRHGERDTGVGGPLVVLEGDARRGIGRRHGAVDGEARRVTHLLEELRLDRLAAGGEHQLQLGAGLDVGAHRPGAALDGVDRRQPHGKRESVEVEVGVVEAGEPVPEHAEGETAPAFRHGRRRRGRPSRLQASPLKVTGSGQ